jgi:hypothetical protein
MNEDGLKTGFADRLKTAAEARAALVAKLRPKTAVTDPNHGDRGDERAAELDAVRQERLEAKAARKLASAEAAQAVADALAADEAATLEAKRGERKQRKAMSNAEAKTRKAAKFAAYRSRTS